MALSELQHILVFRFSAMGDVALAQPVVKQLLEQHPNLHITFVSGKFFEPIFSGIDRLTFHPADFKGRHKGITGLWRLVNELEATKPDAVADLHDVLRSKFLRLVFRGKGFRVEKIDKGRAEKKALIREKNKLFRQLKTTPERYADVFRNLGFELALHFPVARPKQEATRARIGVAPFAQHTAKQYPLTLMENVVKVLSQTHEVFLYGGGQTEKQVLDKWAEQFHNTTSLVGKLPFSQELESMAKLDIMLAMDSGNGHLAAMLGIPVITVWGLTHPYAGFAPVGQPPARWILPDLAAFPQIPTSVYGNNFPPACTGVWATIQPHQLLEKVEKILQKEI